MAQAFHPPRGLTWLDIKSKDKLFKPYEKNNKSWQRTNVN